MNDETFERSSYQRRPFFYFNGVDVATGQYLREPVPFQELADRLGSPAGGGKLGRGEPAPGVEPGDIASSGWGVVFAHDVPPSVHEALRPLLDWREEQASQKGPCFKRYRGAEGVRPGDTRVKWLARQGAGPGPADPRRVPYNLLLVGSPTQIPFEFQFELSLQYATGRLDFDTPEAYARYAEGVVAFEKSEQPQARPRVAVFGVDNADDPATTYARKDLVIPLQQRLREREADWDVESWLGPEATKEALCGILGGAETPDLLFTSSHGLGLLEQDPRHQDALGALLCGDWPGPREWKAEILADHYLAASDIDPAAKLSGLISFHFACYSAGIPLFDSFSSLPTAERPRLAPTPMIAPLPKRLLGGEQSGTALAFIGHVDTARGFSFCWPGAASQPGAIVSVIEKVMDGAPVGTAARYLAERSADIAMALHSAVECGESLELVSDLRIAYADARSYVVLGDPAVRLRQP